MKCPGLSSWRYLLCIGLQLAIALQTVTTLNLLFASVLECSFRVDCRCFDQLISFTTLMNNSRVVLDNFLQDCTSSLLNIII